MQPTDATSQAKKDAAQVTAIEHSAAGPEAAYHAVVKDYLHYQASGASKSQDEQYWRETSADLSLSGVLPNLSVAWANDQLTTGAAGGETSVGQAIDSTKDNEFMKTDLTKFVAENQSSKSLTEQFNVTFARALAADLPKIPENGMPKEYDPSGTVTASDLQAKESSIITVNKQAIAREAQAPLFANNAALLRSLDSAANPGGRLDGWVGQNDLKAWISDYDKATNNGAKAPPSDSVYTKANAAYVQDILNKKYDNAGDGLNSGGFQVNQLGTAGGYDWDRNFDGKVNSGQDYKDLVKAYDKADGSSADPPIQVDTNPVEVGKPALASVPISVTKSETNSDGQITKLSFSNGQTDNITYAADGSASEIEITSQNGKMRTLKPNADGAWEDLASPEHGNTSSGASAVAVGKNGEIVYRRSNGEFASLLPDGSTKTVDASEQATLAKALSPYLSVKVEAGGGYLTTASKVLGIGDTDNSEVEKLAAVLEARLHDEVLQPNQVIDLSEIDDPDLIALKIKAEDKAIAKIDE